MSKTHDQKAQVENSSGGGQIGGTKYGQVPGEATHSGGPNAEKDKPALDKKE